MVKDQGDNPSYARESRILQHFLKTLALLLCLVGCSQPGHLQQSLEQSQADAVVISDSSGSECRPVFSVESLDFGVQGIGCDGKTRRLVVTLDGCNEGLIVYNVLLGNPAKARFRLIEPTTFPLTVASVQSCGWCLFRASQILYQKQCNIMFGIFVTSKAFEI